MSYKDLIKKTAIEQSQMLRNKEVSSVELVNAHFERIEEVDEKLQGIMVNIFHNLDAAAKKYGMEGNYVAGANIAGFLKVVDAMTAQGIV